MRWSLHESRPYAYLRGALILLMVPLAGCTLGASKQAAAPPPPKPAAVLPPVPEPQLSIPQTAVTLPSPQEVNPEAIPVVTAQVSVPEKTDPPPPPRVTRRAAGPPKPEAEAEPEPPAPAPALPEQAPIQPILNGDQQRHIEDAILARRKETMAKLEHAHKPLSKHDEDLVDRITTFLTQCEQAREHGDLSQADALSERALILAREIQVE